MTEPGPAGPDLGRPADGAGAPHVLVMGVSGSGKSTIAAALAAVLGATVIDGDDHHPAANVAKMSAGIPLTDDDRAPWIEELAHRLAMEEAAGRRAILACSALRRPYRDRLRAAVAPGALATVELDCPREDLRARLTGRAHFMPVELLDSQLATLEPLEADEPGVRIDATGDPDAVVDAVLGALGDQWPYPAASARTLPRNRA